MGAADRVGIRERALEAARSNWLLGLLGVLIGIFCYPETVLTPGIGLDPSAGVGIDLASNLGLDQGTQFAWTYGPLGFLESPSVVSGSLTPFAVLHYLALRVGLGISMLWVLRRSLPLVPAVVLAYLACAATQTEIAPLALVAIWSLTAVLADPPTWVARLLTIGGGAFCAIEVLVRLNVGAGTLLVVAIAAVAMPGPRRRHLLELAATFLVTVSVLWLISGQGISNVDDFIRSGAEIVSGYSSAMGIEASPTNWDGAFAGAVTAAILALAWWTSGGLPPLRRLAVAAIVLATAFIAAKQAFVRHDGGHAGVFAGAALASLLALRPPGPGRVVVVAGVLVIALLAAPIRGLSQSEVFRPLDSARMAVEQTYDVLVPGERNELIAAGKERSRAGYDLDPAMLATLRSGTVEVDPWETGIVWAYDLDWRPLPVFQEYAAYTAALDSKNAAALASGDGPDLVLRRRTSPESAVATIDFRYGPYDAPATIRALLCNFRAVQTDDTYQLLERIADRCGAPREVGSVSTGFNIGVPVPRVGPDEMLFARVRGDVASGLRTLAYKDVERTVALDDGLFRLIGSNAENGILLSAPRGIDFPAPFGAAPNPRTIAFGKEAGIATGPSTLQVEFFAVPVERAPAG